jgi:hypothetical protein
MTHDSNSSSMSRRSVVGAAGAGLAAAAATSTAHAQAQPPSPTAAPMTDPATKYPTPPFPSQSQPWPGLAGKMDPRPDHGEAS